jgi:hypothetical protein
MPKNNWLPLVVLVVLATGYVYFFTDWFRPRVILIFHVSRLNPARKLPANSDGAPPTVPVTFGLNTTYRLTELKVVPLADWQTNHKAQPVWHLISDSNSVPIKSFLYGQTLRGMKPAVPGTHATPLVPDEVYHLELQAGRAKGEHDFTAKAVP